MQPAHPDSAYYALKQKKLTLQTLYKANCSNLYFLKTMVTWVLITGLLVDTDFARQGKANPEHLPTEV
jgi:hypothetical protein